MLLSIGPPVSVAGLPLHLKQSKHCVTYYGKHNELVINILDLSILVRLLLYPSFLEFIRARVFSIALYVHSNGTLVSV